MRPGSRQVRSTRGQSDEVDLPQVPLVNRTLGRTFTAESAKEYGPSA